MKHVIPGILFTVLCFLPDQAKAGSVIVNGQTAGPTPFISQLQLTASPPASIKSIKFQITPKVLSVTRPIAATYLSAYLTKRGYYNSQTGAILLPVFGLYDNYANTVTLTCLFTDNSTQQVTVIVTTPPFNDSCGYSTPIVIQARTNSTALSYDYILIKNPCGTSSPVIIDTDGRIRWVGTTGFASFPSTLFQNSIYIAGGTSTLYRMELDGTFGALRDYNSAGVNNFHHNIDFGKRGVILEVDTPAQLEAVDMEIDGLGNVLKIWNLADIITAVMTAGGDDATEFVKPSPTDWFHNNAATYKKSDDSLLVSSRENFVIALDYATGVIKWIFGDSTKQWYQFQSLRNFALALDANTLPPIGQHALSITKDDKLLLFDNGTASLNHTPAGAGRSYSAPRKYQINTQTKVATELWNYPNGQAFYSGYCSSVYEDVPLNYLIDYAIINNIAPPALFAEVLGLDASGNKIFDYRYPTTGCDTAWNAIPVHLEEMQFTTLVPPTAVSRKSHGSAGTFNILLPLTGTPGVECRSGGASGTYRVVVTFASPVTITTATVTPGSGGTGSVSGAPVVSGNQVIVNLTNISNAQTFTVNLIGVNDGSTTENVSVPMTMLIGDTTGNLRTDAGDVTLVRQQTPSTPASLPSWDFRRDVSASGRIDAGDVTLVRQHVPSVIAP
jgi:arylsulfate sulfotransferase